MKAYMFRNLDHPPPPGVAHFTQSCSVVLLNLLYSPTTFILNIDLLSPWGFSEYSNTCEQNSILVGLIYKRSESDQLGTHNRTILHI